MTMEEAFTYIFNLIYTDIVNPLRRALINSSLVNNLNTTINRFLNSFFNIFRETPVADAVYFNNNTLAEFGGLIIAIYCIVLFVKIITFGFSTCSKLMNNLLVDSEKGAWREQWKRKEKRKW